MRRPMKGSVRCDLASRRRLKRSHNGTNARRWRTRRALRRESGTVQTDDNRQRIAKIEKELERLWKYLGYKDDELKARRRRSEIDTAVAQQRKEIASLLSKQDEDAARYVNVIALIGFASYFTTWTLLKPSLSATEAAWVGVLGLISVAAFVLWEIFRMLWRFFDMQGIADLLSRPLTSEEFLERLERLRGIERLRKARRTWIWFAFFAVAIVPGFAGGILLILALARPLLLQISSDLYHQ